MTQYISCIKDGVTGECRDIKDKEARAGIESLRSDLNNITGVDGGHLATDSDITRLEGEIETLKQYDSDFTNVLSAMEGVTTGLQSQITANTNNINSLTSKTVITYDSANETLVFGG